MANLSNINNKFLVTTGGNVLIGKTAANNATVGTQIMSAGDINPTVSGDTVARFNRLSTDGEIIRLQKDTSTVGSIGSTTSYLLGDLGIGTTSPQRNLTIYESLGNAVLQLANSTSGVGASDGFLVFTNGVNVGLENKENGYLSLATNATERMRIRSDGSILQEGPTGGGTNTFQTWQYGNDTNYRLDLKQNVGSGIVKHIFDVVNNSTSYSNTLVLDRGNVGIGTTGPVQPLTVAGNVLFRTTTADNFENRFQFIVGGSGDPGNFYVYNDTESPKVRLNAGGDSYFVGGDVGIGETSPSQKLNVRDDGGSDVFRGIEVHNNNTSLARAGIAFQCYDWVQSAIWHGRSTTAAYGGALVLGTNPNTSDLSVSGVTGRMWILNNGNVGIGTNSPGVKLVVNDTTDGDKIRLEKSGTLVGSVGTYNGVPYIGYQGGAGGGIMFNGSSIEPTALGSSRTNNANDIGSSTYRWRNAFLGGAIYLGGTTAANRLDYYQDGTWTPSLKFGGGDTGITYGGAAGTVYRGGHYTRIGRVVTFSFRIILTSKGTSIGQATIEGLPFIVESLPGNYGSAMYSFANNFVIPERPTITMDSGSPIIRLRYVNTPNGNYSDVTNSGFNNNSDIILTGTYLSSIPNP